MGKHEIVSDAGIDFIKRWEGSVTEAGLHVPYKDIAGFWTIGYGHLLTKDELYSGKIQVGNELLKWELEGLTEEQAEQLLDDDLDSAENAVHDYWLGVINVCPAQHCIDAMVSFTFNLGTGSFKSSTLLKRLLAQNWDDVRRQLMRWVRAGPDKIRIKGLVNRRTAEADLFEYGDYGE